MFIFKKRNVITTIIIYLLIYVSILLATNASIKMVAIIINAFSFGSVIIVNLIKNKGFINIANPTVLYSFSFFLFFGVGFLFLDTSEASVKSLNIVSTCVIISSVVIGLVSLIDFPVNPSKQKITGVKLKKSKIFANVVFLIAFLGFLLFIKKVQTLPIFLSNLEQSRVNSSLDVGGGLRIVIYFFIISGIISMQNIYYSNILNIKKGGSIFVWFMSIICLISLGNRSPAFTIIAVSIFIYLFSKNQTKFKLKDIFKILVPSAILIYLFVGGIGAYRVLKTPEMWSYKEYVDLISNKNYFGLVNFSFFHYFSIGIGNFINLLAVVPSIIKFQYGYTYLMPIITFLPGKQYTIDMILKTALGQTYLGGGTIPSFLGEAYINFGFWGPFLVPLLTLCLLIFLKYRYCLVPSLGNQIIYIYIYSYLCFSQLSGIAATSAFPLVAVIVLFFYKEVVK